MIDFAINLSEAEKTVIKGDVNQTFKTLLNSSFKKFLISPKYKIIIVILVILLPLAFTGGLVGTTITYSLGNVSKFAKLIALISLIISVFFWILFLLLVLLQRKFYKKVLSSLAQHYLKYLQMITTNHLRRITFTNITNDFSLVPEKFIVSGSSFNRRVWTEKVIIGKFNEQDFNIGTKIEEITKSTGKNTVKIYNRYLYFTCSINDNDFSTTIVPETLMTKFKDIFNKKKIELESQEFEKMFALDYHDPLALRKLLSPKVMNKMINLGKTNTVLPNIFINKKQITICFVYHNIGHDTKPIATLLNLIINNKQDQQVTNVINMLKYTINLYLTCHDWIAALDLWQEI